MSENGGPEIKKQGRRLEADSPEGMARKWSADE